MFKFYKVNCYKLGGQYRVVYLKQSLFEDGYHVKKDFGKNEKIGDRWKSNIIRARSKVLSLGLCNDWEYFVTFTLDKTKYDRTNLKSYIKDLSQWLRNLRNKNGFNISYLLIPELHSDGSSWHLHGLINGIPDKELSKFSLEKGHPFNLVFSTYRNWERYQNKFGYCTVDTVRSKAAVSRYILKYIAKGMDESVLDMGQHLYYASKGLKTPELIAEGYSDVLLGEVGFENDFLATSWLDKAGMESIISELRWY